MTDRLGISVGKLLVSAARVRGRHVTWAGRAKYTGAGDLSDAIAHLAAECPRCPRRVRVVFERDVVQVRSLVPAPPIPKARAAAFVGLEASRLFRNGRGRLISDAVLQTVKGQGRVLYAAAAEEELSEAVARGCDQAGLKLEAVGPASDVLAHSGRSGTCGVSEFPVGRAVEHLEHVGRQAWRSRLLQHSAEAPTHLAAPLATLGDAAPSMAAAYAAAIAKPTLNLLSPSSRAAAVFAMRRRSRWLGALAVAAIVLAALVFDVRVRAARAAADRELASVQPQVEHALRTRRDLADASAALQLLHDAADRRSRYLDLIAALGVGLSDSVVVVALEASGDSVVRVSALAPSAAGAVAEMERVPLLRHPRVEGIVGRQAVTTSGGRREWDQFTVRTALRGRP